VVQSTLNVLMVGILAPVAERFAAHRVSTLAEASALLRTSRFRVTLAAENLPDGKGYDLSRLIARQEGNLFVAIPLSATLWLPAVERGNIVLGRRAFNASLVENEMEIALGATRTPIEPAGPSKLPRAAGVLHRIASPKRGVRAA
jgi:hypothetical protein